MAPLSAPGPVPGTLAVCRLRHRGESRRRSPS
jgi:hypothetical protein